MSQLFLLRHGIAIPRGTPDLSDDDRPLSPKGAKRMRQIGHGLRCLGIELDAIVASPLPRAWETAEIIARSLAIPDRLEACDTLRDDRNSASIRDWIRTRDEPRLMIVGHNPALSELAGLLLADSAQVSLCELKTGGIAAFSSRGEGDYTLDWLAPPRLLRRIADD